MANRPVAYGLYILGFLVLIVGLAMAANLLGIPRTWIIAGIVVLAGLVILGMAGNVNQRP